MKTFFQRSLFCGILLWVASFSLVHSQLRVGTLHPLLADLAKQVGGDKITVVELVKPGMDVHHFEPTSKDIASLKGVSLILAIGKGMEGYLDKLADSTGSGVSIVEVGKTIPSIKMEANDDLYLCCPNHHHGSVDPHWWHSAENMRRAARVVANLLVEKDPANEGVYLANAEQARKKYAQWKSWAQKQLSAIPRSQRKLVTAHAAFGYFCKEYGFKTLPILGISREDEASSQHLIQAVKVIRDQKIRAVFPEDQANPKVLAEIVRDTGVKLGKPLIADGTTQTPATFEALLKYNVEAIVEALK